MHLIKTSPVNGEFLLTGEVVPVFSSRVVWPQSSAETTLIQVVAVMSLGPELCPQSPVGRAVCTSRGRAARV